MKQWKLQPENQSSRREKHKEKENISGWDASEEAGGEAVTIEALGRARNNSSREREKADKSARQY